MSDITITLLFRHPVKSMMGESLQSLFLSEGGVPRDRAWAVKDEVRGGIRGGKKLPKLMRLGARYEQPPARSGSSTATITLSDGREVSTNDPDINEVLSADLEHAVSLWPLLPAEQQDHYRRGEPDSEDFEAELRDMFAREADEPLPDIGQFPPELLEFESPPGTYFDAFPLLLLSEQSLLSMAKQRPDANWDVRRFRPNILLSHHDTSLPFPEQSWVSKKLQ